MMNLVKYIAAGGAASRRQAETLIKEGKVAVNGILCTNPAHRVADDEKVTLEGRLLQTAEKLWYILLNKPRGYVCSSADTHAEHLALELLAAVPARLVSAGRLDKESQGAIIFSNDGNFINRLAHPRYGVLKTYIVRTKNELKDEDLKKISSGITDDGELLKAESIRATGKKCYEVILNEGKKREIRRLTAACGAPTVQLTRVKIGSVELGELPEGRFRELTAEEVAELLGANDV